jgi:hypothetical protein
MKSATLTFCTVIGLAAAVAQADWITRPLQGHASALISGTTSFTGASTVGLLDVDVDWAVFAPGEFSLAGGVFSPFPGFGAPSATDYIYAYQIYNKGATHGGVSDTHLSSLNINFGTMGSVSSLGSDPGFDADGTDVNATLAVSFPPTASYLFYLPSLGVDEFSVVLLLSSPKAPTMSDVSNVIDGGLAINGQLPAPVPSPAAAVLGLIGLAFLGLGRRVVG